MSTKLPRDGNSQPIPVLAFASSSNGITTGTSYTIGIPAGTKVIRISTLEASYVCIGDSTAVVGPLDGALLPAGSISDWAVGDATHVAVRQSTIGDIIAITALK